MSKGMGGHQSATPESVTYITPPELYVPFGPFDLDPCTPPVVPWEIAPIRFTEKEDGLAQDWFGDVFMNPPWGHPRIVPWLQKMAYYGRGMVLQPARTDTKYFRDYVWNGAHGLYWLFYRPHFYDVEGNRYKANCGCPVVFAAYGKRANDQLKSFNLEPGRYTALIETTQHTTGFTGSWFTIVSSAIRHLGPDDLQAIYELVERLAPEKCAENKHHREKIRQQKYRYINNQKPTE